MSAKSTQQLLTQDQQRAGVHYLLVSNSWQLEIVPRHSSHPIAAKPLNLKDNNVLLLETRYNNALLLQGIEISSLCLLLRYLPFEVAQVSVQGQVYPERKGWSLTWWQVRSSPIAMLMIYLTSSLTSLTEVGKSVLEKLGALVHLSHRGLSFRFFHYRPSRANWALVNLQSPGTEQCSLFKVLGCLGWSVLCAHL